MEKEKAQAVEQQAKVSEQKKAEEFKAQLEAQLKHQRLAAQQVGSCWSSQQSASALLTTCITAWEMKLSLAYTISQIVPTAD